MTKQLSIEQHFKELRNRVIICIFAFLAGFGICFHFSETILEFILQFGKASGNGYSFVYYYPQELFMQYISISLTGGIFLALPVIIFEAVCFIFPALTKKEKVSLVLYLAAGVVLFGLGLYFAYKIIIPFILNYFYSLSRNVPVKSSVSVEKYVALLKSLFLTFACTFEIPVISAVLTQARILNPQRMKVIRPAVIVLIFIIAAVITPPDVISQCMVAVPMAVLYQGSIGISKLITGRRDRKNKKNGKKEKNSTCQSE